MKQQKQYRDREPDYTNLKEQQCKCRKRNDIEITRDSQQGGIVERRCSLCGREL